MDKYAVRYRTSRTVAQKTETRSLDCKTSFSWDTADHDAKCELVKDILAFLNTQDGGQIVVGVEDDTLEPVGMTDADFTSFDVTKVNDFLHRYTDPQSSCEVQKLTFSGLKFVVINVLEFKDIPIICKKAANSSKDPSKTILKLGGVYTRTRRRRVFSCPRRKKCVIWLTEQFLSGAINS